MWCDCVCRCVLVRLVVYIGLLFVVFFADFIVCVLRGSLGWYTSVVWFVLAGGFYVDLLFACRRDLRFGYRR